MATRLHTLPGQPGEGRDDPLAANDPHQDAINERKDALRARVFTLDEMLTQETEQADPLLGRYLQRGEVTILGGHGGQGKSTMAMGMVRAVVESGKFLDAVGDGGRVMYVDLEQGIGVAQKAAMRAWFPTHYEDGVPVSELMSDIDLGLLGESVTWCDWREGASLDMLDTIFDVIVELTGEHAPDLIVLDPVYKLMLGSNANELEVVGRLIGHVERIRARYPLVAWLIPMHPRKPPAQGSKIPDEHDLYGSAAWGWWAGNVFTVQRSTGNGANFKIAKDRITGMREDWALELKPDGKGYERLASDAGPDGPVSPERKIWDLVQRSAPVTLSRKQLQEVLVLSQKQVENATKRIVAAHNKGKYPGLIVETTANNALRYGFEDSDPIVAALKREFDATEEDW